MFLKFLALEGFKSFPEWNGLELSPGISVLVGQNGTGKSNLTDAITWGLGEDDPDVLRSRSDVDLVFCGSEELFPTDAAQVTLVFGARPPRLRGALAPLPPTVAKHGQRAEHTGEVPEGDLTVTRLLPRDGEDHFLIDGAPADREQVRRALEEAGLGSSPLTSVIRQGALERLLFLAPDERRHAVEEAAGIPHLSAQARVLTERHESALWTREHIAGEKEQAERRLPVLVSEAARLDEARDLDTRLARARGEALAAAYRGEGAESGRPPLDRILEVLDLPAPRPDPAGNWATWEAEVDSLAHRREELGEVNPGAAADLARTREEIAVLEERDRHMSTDIAQILAEQQAVQEEIAQTFAAALSRVEQRFRAYYSLLAPGGEASLPLVDVPGRPGEPGVEVVARPPGKLLDRVDVLSGGERSLAALSFALGLFQEYSSPLFILDEVEPALDDANIGRLQAVLDMVAEERQLVMVSHQQRAKETGDVVFGVERNLDGASQVKFRYEPATLRLEVFRRTWAASHLRRHRDETKGGPDRGTGARPTVVSTSGSPTQAALVELFGPASGASRDRAFHEDGTFRGIMDAVKDREEREQARADARGRPAAAADDQAGPGDDPEPPAQPKCCC